MTKFGREFAAPFGMVHYSNNKIQAPQMDLQKFLENPTYFLAVSANEHVVMCVQSKTCTGKIERHIFDPFDAYRLSIAAGQLYLYWATKK